MACTLVFRALGPLEVWRDTDLVRLRAAKQRALLGLLLIRRSGVDPDLAVDALWGGQPPRGWRNTLQVYVSSLRKALGRDAIETTPLGYRLIVEPGAVDVDRFEELYRAGVEALAAGDAANGREALAEGLSLWRGPAFADLRFHAFAQAEAGRLDELRLACLEERIEADLRLDKRAGLVGELESLVVEQPLRERLRGQLILALYRSGRQAEALAQFQATRRMLADELGLEPSPRLRELERMILAHDPKLAPPPQERSSGSNLPHQPTPFIGRDQELAELIDLVRKGTRRLVTLTGPGGSGKTRLAIEAARALEGAYSDGVLWVPLQTLQDAEFVLPAIAGAVASTSRDLVSYIADRRMLFILDNFEQLLDAAVETASLLSSCPNLTVVVTSRERLRVAAEREYRVLPMSETDAIALFDERADQRSDAEVVRKICRRLDCLPLAVELAAARTRLLTAEQILVRLNDLSLLGRGPRDAPARQQTLRAAIAWSYDLLAEDEQRLLRNLSVFAGGSSYEAAEAIAGADPDTLESLLDKSLVQRLDSAIGRRYSLLETIRDFARERSQSELEFEPLRRRHANWFLVQSEKATAAQLGNETVYPQPNPREWLRAELPNLRTALNWAFDQGENSVAQELAASSALAWSAAGACDEGRTLITRALEETGDIPPGDRAKILHRLAIVTVSQGDAAAAEAFHGKATELFEQSGDSRGAFHAALNHVQDATDRADIAQARSRLQRALRTYSPVNDYDQARLCWAQAQLAGLEKRYPHGQALLEQAVMLLARHGRPTSWDSNLLLGLAWFALHTGDLARAKSAMQTYLADAPVADPVMIAAAHRYLGLVAIYEDDAHTAARHFSEGFTQLAKAPGARWGIDEALYCSAAAAAINGDNEEATRLWGAADNVKRSTGHTRSQPEQALVDRHLEPARAALTPSTAAQAEAEGAAMGVNEAVRYALEKLARADAHEDIQTLHPFASTS